MKFYHNYKSKFYNIHSYRNFQSCNELKTINFMTGMKQFQKCTHILLLHLLLVLLMH